MNKYYKISFFILLLIAYSSTIFYYTYKSDQDIKKSLQKEQDEIAKTESYFNNSKQDSNYASQIHATTKTTETAAAKPADSAQKNTVTISPEKSYLELPIFMYHYIRDYSDPNDQLGINLSVSPNTLAAQLDYIQKQGYTTITFENVKNNSIPKKPIMLTFDDGYLDFYTNAFPQLKARGMKAVVYIITSPPAYGEYLTKNQIRELSDYGIEIGSHTISHRNLATATDEKAIEEITKSKAYLEKIIGKPVISFCYPSGQYNTQTPEIVKNAGYLYAVTTKKSLSSLESPFEISRFKIGDNSNLSIYFK